MRRRFVENTPDTVDAPIGEDLRDSEDAVTEISFGFSANAGPAKGAGPISVSPRPLASLDSV